MARTKVLPWKNHPAKFPDEVLDTIEPIIRKRHKGTEGFDPFCGTGRFHLLADRCGVETIGYEIEPEGAVMHKRTICGNSKRLPKDWTGRFKWIFTSPGYANRMSDHHNAKEVCKPCRGGGIMYHPLDQVGDTGSRCEKCGGTGKRNHKRLTYRHTLPVDRELHEDNSGRMQWGPKYRDLHLAADGTGVWAEVYRVLAKGGYFYLNIKNHIKTIKGVQQEVDVIGWHVEALTSLGFKEVERIPVKTKSMGFGQNREARTECEWIIVFRKPGRA